MFMHSILKNNGYFNIEIIVNQLLYQKAWSQFTKSDTIT